jgi:hypothetical protein
MPRLRLTLAVALLLAAPAAQAADDKGRFAVKGPGLVTCKQLLEPKAEREQEAAYFFGGWLLGFVTAQNQHLKDTYDLASWVGDESLYGMVRNHCSKRPDDRLAEVALQLVRFLQPQRLSSESKLTVAQAGDKGVRLYEEVLRRAQEELKQQGHYRGVVDGLFGPGTQTAFEAYQQAKGIPVTGLPDQRTLFSMFADDLRGAATESGSAPAPRQ